MDKTKLSAGGCAWLLGGANWFEVRTEDGCLCGTFYGRTEAEACVRAVRRVNPCLKVSVRKL